jgi:quercetin dioxygenase-like cupin family protein
MSSLAKRIALVIALLVAVTVSRHAAGQSGAQQRLTPGEIKWPAGGSSLVGTSGVSGIQTVTLKGDPTKPGVYALLLRAGPNTRIQSHAHPDDRVATIVSGTWYFGYGREFDERALKELPAGSFYTEPPGMNHFAMTKGEGVVIQITGYGPTGTTYVDPRNDPTKKP